MKLNTAKLKLDQAYRVGRSSPNKPRPLLVTFQTFADREYTLLHKKRLAGSNVYINEDLPPEILRQRRQLIPIVKAAKKRNHKCWLNGDKLCLDGKIINNLNELPPELTPSQISTPTKDNITIFFSKASPLSNHYPCKFVIDDTEYNCTEQFLMKNLSL